MEEIHKRMIEQTDQLAQDRIDRNARIRELEGAAWRAAKWMRDMSSDNQREVLEDLCGALGVDPDQGRRFEKGLTLEEARSSMPPSPL